jgi:hypothetical protein
MKCRFLRSVLNKQKKELCLVNEIKFSLFLLFIVWFWGSIPGGGWEFFSKPPRSEQL